MSAPNGAGRIVHEQRPLRRVMTRDTDSQCDVRRAAAVAGQSGQPAQAPPLLDLPTANAQTRRHEMSDRSRSA